VALTRALAGGKDHHDVADGSIVDGLPSYGHCKGAVLSSLQCAWENVLKADRSEVLQGTLDLTIPKALYALGPQRGFRVARHRRPEAQT
jgi:hypothetical protein